jgi:hypothetical protein
MQFASNLQAIPTNFDRIVQYSSKYCIIVQFHHASSILHHCMHPCNAALPGSLAHQPCRKVCKLFYGRRPACMHACMQYWILLLGRQFSSSFPRNLRHCDFEPCVRIDIDLWTRVMTEVIFSLVLNGLPIFSRSCGLLMSADGLAICLNGLAICCHIFRVARSFSWTRRASVLPRNCCCTDATLWTKRANWVRFCHFLKTIFGSFFDTRRGLGPGPWPQRNCTTNPKPNLEFFRHDEVNRTLFSCFAQCARPVTNVI